MYKLGKHSEKALEGVNAELAMVIRTAIGNSPVDFMVTEGVRTQERQVQLYAQGRKTRGKIVTNADGVNIRSKHQTGRAVDICPWVEGKLAWEDDTAFNEISGHIKRVAKVLNVRIKWGGDFKGSWDKPHYELEG